MEPTGKIIIGALATAVLAWGTHAAMGDKFVGGLEKSAADTLAKGSMSGITVAATREPSLSRLLVLSGNKTDAEKKAALDAVRAVPGVADAVWEGDEAAAKPALAEKPAAAEAVAECQSDLNALMKDKVINFQSGSAYLAPESNRLIADVAKALKPCAGMSVEVQGHTDLMGAAATNEQLSQARAEAVLAALVTDGVPKERLTAKGYGSSQPLENATTRAANTKNRRTVFAVAAAGAAPAPTPEGGQ